MVLTVVAAGAVLGRERPAIAADPPSAGMEPQVAQSAEARSFSIPAQPLATALDRFADQAGVSFAYRTGDLSTLQSPGVVGTFTPRDALQRLLVGTGVSFSFIGASTVTLAKAPDTGGSVVRLDPLKVEARGSDSPYGPGVGYIARQSVTGTKTDTPLIETPQSISVITRQQMDDQAVQNTGQALRYTAGVAPELRAVNGIFDNYMYVRGFRPDQYLDGLKLIGGNFGASQIDPYLLNRIEILRGPASVLYGQGTPGGVVTLTSKRPTEQPLREVMLQVGSYGHLEGAFDFSGPLDKDGQFLYRMTGIGFQTGSQIDFSNNGRFAIAPSFTWKPDANTSLTVLSQFQRDSGPVFNGFVPARGSVLGNPYGQIPTSLYVGDPNYDSYNRTQAQIGYTFEHIFDDRLTFRQNVRYQNLYAVDESLYANGLQANLYNLNRYSFNDSESLDTFTIDNQALAKLSTGPLNHTLLVGLDYQWNTYRQFGASNFNVPALNLFNPVYYLPIVPPNLNPASSFSNAQQSQSQVGLYVQDQIKVGGWSFILGGRQDWVSSNASNYVSMTNTSKFDQAFTYRAGLVYLFENGIAPYASYTTSFSPTAGTDFSGNPFVPTTGEQIEVGIKYQPLGWNSFLTASAYNLTQQNVLTTDPLHPGFSTQTGEIRVRGVELEAHANLTPNLDLVAAYTFTDGIYSKSNTVAATINGAPMTVQGQPLNGVPAQMASLWANYTIDAGAAKGLGFGGGVRYMGPSPGDNVNSFVVPSFTLFDATIRYDLGKALPALDGLQFQLNAANLFDVQYVSSCVNASFCSYGLRRTIYATLKYKW